ncbi:helix-turn-helix transcriptional regulator [Kordiimonas sp.]|uniref:helix-turn-helix transcriptional regulator n=1 Tax=Kordiimonas sp. TaxID=1970157 RepID=UPI003B522D71
MADFYSARSNTTPPLQWPTFTPPYTEIGLSLGFFTRSFTAAVGRSPQQFIIDRRISRARAQLRDSSLSIGAIAFECGFSSHAHMSFQFRKYLSITPSQLRLNRSETADESR